MLHQIDAAWDNGFKNPPMNATILLKYIQDGYYKKRNFLRELTMDEPDGVQKITLCYTIASDECFLFSFLLVRGSSPVFTPFNFFVLSFLILIFTFFFRGGF